MTWKVHLHYMDTAEKYTFKLLHNRVFFLTKYNVLILILTIFSMIMHKMHCVQ